jgi:hypothetical protein
MIRKSFQKEHFKIRGVSQSPKTEMHNPQKRKKTCRIENAACLFTEKINQA